MKRFTLIVTMVVLMSMPMLAERVSPDTARKAAITFLSNNGAKTDQLTDLSKEAGFPNLYIFNSNPGFVVMAADDCVQPILGYSLSNKFVVEGMPENISSWLQMYSDEIQSAIDNKARATDETVRQWKDLLEGNPNVAKATTIVAPLIQTQWNQGSPYNNLCPSGSVTGCVATAMAQVMKYWNYPSHGIGSHSYTPQDHPEYGIQTADFNSTNYDWTNMTNTYGNSSTNVQRTAVATLMYHCGVSVEMNYSPRSSGAVTAHVADALKTYFNYSSDVQHISRSSYSDATWISMLKAELDLNHPIQYHGTGSGGGHSFVCDGYNNNNYFHFNWGWSGYCDDYYTINNLNPGPGGIGSGSNGIYNDDQGAIFGVHPSDCTASEPTNLTYTLSGLQGLTLNWNEANGAVSYNIYRNGNLVGTSTTTTYQEAAPFGNNVYYVRCVDNAGNLSLSSNTVSVFVDYQQPVVDDLEATLDGDNVSLSWTAPEWCYPETESAVLNYGQGNVYYSWNSVYYAHRHLAANLAQHAGKAVYKISTYVQYPGTYSVYIYTKTRYNKPDPNNLAFSNTGVSVTISNGWYEFDTDSPIILSGTDDLWVVIKQENTGQEYPVPSFNLSAHNTNAFYAGSYSPTSLSDAGSNYNCAWFINTYLTDGVYTYNLYRNDAMIASNLSSTTYNTQLHPNNTNFFCVKTNYYGGEAESNKIGFTTGNATLPNLNLKDIDIMTVLEGNKLTVSGTLSSTNPASLILENGAQLIHSSNNVAATVKKDITAYSPSQNNGWHLIASPVTDSVTPSVDNGLLANNYDLYTFNQSQQEEWRNYEAQSFNITHGTGYLYANSGNPTIAFSGTLATSVSPTSLTYDNNATFKGFNLIGNPYPCNTYVTGRSFYVLQDGPDGSDFVVGSNPIPPCAAILVQAQGSNELVTFSKTASRTEPNITISVAEANTRSNAVIDKARVSFNEKDWLVKYNVNDQSGRLYIPQNGQDYAVAYVDGQDEMPVNFKAAQNGTYTVSIEVENLHLSYLRLIDNLTGNDIDLLATPSYTFEATTTDDASRFRLVFNNK